MVYKTSGVCCTEIHIDIEDNGIIKSVQFHKGCAGNASGLSRLLVGMKVDDVIERLMEPPAEIKPLPAQISWLKP